MKNTTASSFKTETAIGSDRYMHEHGFREVTKAERKRFRELTEKIFIERHPKGYAIRRAGLARVSAIETTQAKAIQRARRINPSISPHVERVRNTGEGSPVQWRKA
jgi:hypothetical protein